MPILTIYKPNSKKYDDWTDKWVYYEEFMKLFLSSLHRHNPEETVIIKLLGGNEDLKSSFLSLNPNITFEDESDKDIKGKELWTYFREIEFKWWKEKLTNSTQTFIHTDNDLLFRGNIQEIYTLMSNYDIGFPYDAGADDRSKYNKGIFAVRGEKGLEFIKEWEETSKISHKGDRQDGWYTTQLAVFHILTKNKYKLLKFPGKFHDSRLTPKSIIWHAHKASKHKNLVKFKEDKIKFL